MTESTINLTDQLSSLDLNEDISEAKILVWNIKNIKGIAREDNKNHKDFMKYIKPYDILFFSETGLMDRMDDNNEVVEKGQIAIHGFENVIFVNRTRKKGRGRDSGGLAVFAKPDIAKYIKIVAEDKAGREYLACRIQQSPKDFLYIIFMYIPDNNSSIYNEYNIDKNHYFKVMKDVYNTLSAVSTTFICGDLNARTGVKMGFIPPKGPDDDETVLSRRTSEDTTVNKFGTDLLSVCKDIECVIANGFYGKDQGIGEYTYYGLMEETIVDYLILSHDKRHELIDFDIKPFNEFSDHAPLMFSIKLDREQTQVPSGAIGGENVAKILVWNARNIKKIASNDKFLKYIEPYDILLFSDKFLKNNDDIKIAGFKNVRILYRPREENTPGTDSAGLAVFAKPHIKLEIVKEDEVGRGWLVCEIERLEDSLYIIFMCIPPEGSIMYEQHKIDNNHYFTKMKELYNCYSIKETTFICGDLNARTRDNLDFIPPIESDDDEAVLRRRTSEDVKLAHHGRELSSVCMDIECVIANGRYGKDRGIGKYTYHDRQNKSTVDYLVLSPLQREKLLDFDIKPFNKFSDHAPLMISIKLDRKLSPETRGATVGDVNEPPSENVAKVLVWNVRNIKKISIHDRFLKYIEPYDILLFSDKFLKNNDDIKIAGFKNVRFLNRPQEENTPGTPHGGLAVFAKPHIKLEIVKEDEIGRGWLVCEIKRPEDSLYIIFMCIPPEGSDMYKQHKIKEDHYFTKMKELYKLYSIKGTTFICGDLNARTRDNLDFIPPEEPDEPTESDDEAVLKRRTSEDIKLAHHGRELLSVCMNIKCVIANGRYGKDRGIGKYTYRDRQNKSTVDYLVLSPLQREKLLDFDIKPFYKFSDHAPLMISIKLDRKQTPEISGPTAGDPSSENVAKILVWNICIIKTDASDKKVSKKQQTIKKNKIEKNHKDFMEYIKPYDILLFSETWVMDIVDGKDKVVEKGQINIPGFQKVIFLNRHKKKEDHSSPHGRLEVFVKPHIKQYIKIVKEDEVGSEWLVCRIQQSRKDCLYIIFMYIPDETSKMYGQHKIQKDYYFKVMKDLYNHYSTMGTTFICGDLNARTRDNLDFRLPTECDDDDGGEAVLRRRTSEDIKLEHHGRKLVSVCKKISCVIANGRYGKDRGIGKYTFRGSQDKSIVDYLIFSHSDREKLIDFDIEPFNKFSDHAPLMFSIKFDWKQAPIKSGTTGRRR